MAPQNDESDRDERLSTYERKTVHRILGVGRAFLTTQVSENAMAAIQRDITQILCLVEDRLDALSDDKMTPLKEQIRLWSLAYDIWFAKKTRPYPENNATLAELITIKAKIKEILNLTTEQLEAWKSNIDLQ